MASKTVYTLTRHSAWVANTDPQFLNAVETRAISGADHTRVVKAGGPIFGTYGEASEAEEAQNYPDGTPGLIPRAQGTFVEVPKLGFEVYKIPVPFYRVLVEQTTSCWVEVEADSAEEALQHVEDGDYEDRDVRVDKERIRVYTPGTDDIAIDKEN